MDKEEGGEEEEMKGEKLRWVLNTNLLCLRHSLLDFNDRHGHASRPGKSGNSTPPQCGNKFPEFLGPKLVMLAALVVSSLSRQNPQLVEDVLPYVWPSLLELAHGGGGVMLPS